MDATISNDGKVGLIKEVDEYGRVVLGKEFSGEEVTIAFEVQE